MCFELFADDLVDLVSVELVMVLTSRGFDARGPGMDLLLAQSPLVIRAQLQCMYVLSRLLFALIMCTCMFP